MAEEKREPTWEDAVAEMHRMANDDTYDELIKSSTGTNNPLKPNGKDLAIAGVDDAVIGGAIAGALGTGIVGAKNAHDNANKSGKTEVLGDGLLGSKTESKEETPNGYKPRKLGKNEELNLMLDLVMGGLSTKEMMQIMKSGVISNEQLNKLDNDTKGKLEKIYGFPMGTKSTSMPIPEKKDNTETFPSESKKEPSRTTLKKEGDLSHGTTIEGDKGVEHDDGGFYLEPADANRLIEMVKKLYPEASQKQIVEWTMSTEGRKRAKELGITPSELGEALWRASVQNTAAKAQQEEYERNKSASGESRKNAHDSARENAKRNAEKADKKIEEMGLNPYLKKK